MSSRPGASVQSAVDRFAWPVVLVLVVFVLVAIFVAINQTREVDKAYRDRDATVLNTTEEVIYGIIKSQTGHVAQWISQNSSDVQSGDDDSVKSSLDEYIQNAPGEEIAIGVTDADGRLVHYATHVEEQRPAVQSVSSDIDSFAASTIRKRSPQVSGRIQPGGRPWFVQALPLFEGSKYGTVLVVFDAETTAIGKVFTSYKSNTSYKAQLRGEQTLPAIVDDHQIILGNEKIYKTSTISKKIRGTNWRLLLPRTKVSKGIPPWIYKLMFIAVVILGAFLWVQERTRRALRIEAEEKSDRLSALYDFAGDMLTASSVRDQASQLARALMQALPIAGTRVRIARERNLHGIVAGEAQLHYHQYRLALRGHKEPIGEVVIYTSDFPLLEEERAIVQTFGAMAGAAMQTVTILETERDTAKELQRIDELRTNLLSTVAHELRSPLTAIKGVLGLLTFQGGLSPKQQEYVEVAEERTDSLVELIRELFDCSLLESGQLTISPERKPATQLLDSSLGALAASRPTELYLNATPNLMMTADPLRFDQIVNNLVTNAFRHGKAPVEVMIRPYSQGAMVTVQDSGPGIPAEERDRIFNKFYQSDSGNARLVEGAGLGLALVHGLVTLHGGKIEVDSVRLDGTGALFRIYFPDIVESPRGNESITEPTGTTSAA